MTWSFRVYAPDDWKNERLIFTQGRAAAVATGFGSGPQTAIPGTAFR